MWLLSNWRGSEKLNQTHTTLLMSQNIFVRQWEFKLESIKGCVSNSWGSEKTFRNPSKNAKNSPSSCWNKAGRTFKIWRFLHDNRESFRSFSILQNKFLGNFSFFFLLLIFSQFYLYCILICHCMYCMYHIIFYLLYCLFYFSLNQFACFYC